MRTSSLPDKAEVVSVEGRRVSLLRFSGAGVPDSRVETQGCSARSGRLPPALLMNSAAGPTEISVCLLLHAHRHPHALSLSLTHIHTQTHTHTHTHTGCLAE